VSVDGPLFGEDFEQELLTAGKARRFRALQQLPYGSYLNYGYSRVVFPVWLPVNASHDPRRSHSMNPNRQNLLF
jgi:hypothetical protein